MKKLERKTLDITIENHRCIRELDEFLYAQIIKCRREVRKIRVEIWEEFYEKGIEDDVPKDVVF